MKKEIKEYLEGLKEKFETNENWYQGYKMIGSKILEIGIASTQKELNELISENIDDENIKYVIKLYYNVALKNYTEGPLSVICIINPIINGTYDHINPFRGK